ncbi:CAP domain-containing protein [Bacillus haynesii]|uniref:CAP domain-containing protein n=1 Tax=Bacillus haynesii TaxID=1925021 RepID=UPI002281F522|nr:CAP domain-containing protein [Bacillus haynesii]MCY8143245.1 CAP domain-containing protein [Bacillus haynesii]MEC1455044.1 CAP domain-containing protein [Bacillus haynesii]MEC1571674.1 CAP domain-containing protein [Bacillus haynesii]
MKKAFLLSAAAAATLFTFSGVQHADAKEQQQVQVKTVHSINVTDLAGKLNIQNMDQLSKADQEKIQSLLHSYMKQATQQPKTSAPKSSAPKASKPESKQTQKQEASKPAASKEQTSQQKQDTAPASSSVSAYEKEVVELTNAERKKQGLKPLTLDEKLSKVARTKSQDMKDNNYFDHNSPTYGSPFDMMKKFGITYRTAGENIAKGQKTPQEVVKAWMNSEGHRKNIMNPNFTHIGVGYVKDGNYWTQQFIGK